jgi:predicted nucleotidyltransferase
MPRKSGSIGVLETLSISKNKKDAVSKYLEILQEKYLDKIENVILFGSAARGESDKESDVDILVVLKKRDEKLRDEVSMAAFDVILSSNVVISPIVMNKEMYEWHKWYRDPLYNNIERDGIDLWMKS